ncbi:MAG TPA: hypothetical protein VF523_11835, partial [Burkholderiales bacterium]
MVVIVAGTAASAVFTEFVTADDAAPIISRACGTGSLFHSRPAVLAMPIHHHLQRETTMNENDADVRFVSRLTKGT